MKIIILIFTLTSFLTFGQKKYIKQVDSLKYVVDMPYSCQSGPYPLGPNSIRMEGCGDKIFWNIVKSKDSVINLLINKLDDPKVTKAVVPNIGDEYAVADIAFEVLKEIIHSLPEGDYFIKRKKEREDGYWKYVRKNNINRKKFKIAVRKWYEVNKDKLVWIISDSQFRTGEMGKFIHPNGGHYELKN